MNAQADFIVVGGGSAGCIVAAELARSDAGSVLLLEAGPSDRHPLVQMPFGLTWLMGSKKRNWCYQSSPQKNLGDRVLQVPRGRMLGGSGSINSMVWFRGCPNDFDNWNIKGWSWNDVKPLFEAVEAKIAPQPMKSPHPLSQQFHRLLHCKKGAPLTPERESAGVFRYNMQKGRRWSSVDAFLRPMLAENALHVHTGAEVDKLLFEKNKASGTVLRDGTVLRARKGVVLAAGTIGSPAILMRSGIGPAKHLKSLGIPLVYNSEQVGENLHDHPGAGLYFVRENSGYGLTLRQLPYWVAAPFRYLSTREGRFASPTVEGGAFFSATGKEKRPNVQSHFIPFMLGWRGRRFTFGSGYFADVCVCRPKSRGRLQLSSRQANAAPTIDLGIFQNSHDLDVLTAGLMRLRALMNEIDFGERKAPEAFPAETARSEQELRKYVLQRCGTAYHPVGTLRMGDDDSPVSARLAVRGADKLWVADASVMPSITSANTNAPSMMIGYHAGQIITQDCR